MNFPARAFLSILVALFFYLTGHATGYPEELSNTLTSMVAVLGGCCFWMGSKL